MNYTDKVSPIRILRRECIHNSLEWSRKILLQKYKFVQYPKGRFYKLMERESRKLKMEGRYVKHILTPASQGFKLETANQSYGQVLLQYMYACMGRDMSQENVNCLGSSKVRQFFIPKLIAPFFYLGLSGIEKKIFWKYTNDILKAERMNNSKGVRANLGVGLLF